jgi:hypothetical protein
VVARTAERERGSDEQTDEATADTGLTEDERAALGLMIGWAREFKRINKEVCKPRQQRINQACRPEIAGRQSAPRPVDDGVADGRCVHGPDGLEPTDAVPRGIAALSLAGPHLLG